MQQATAYFTDINSPNSVGLDYQVTAYTGSDYPLSEAIIYEVTVTNVTDAAIENIRVGMFANWIVRTGAVVTTNRQLQLVTTKSIDIYPYTHGLAILSDTESFNNYSFDTGVSPRNDITDNYHTRDVSVKKREILCMKNNTCAFNKCQNRCLPPAQSLN